MCRSRRVAGSSLVWLCLGLIAGSGTRAEAGLVNLVQNPGFETGDFTDWTQSSNPNGTLRVDSIAPHSGSFSAHLPTGNDVSSGSLNQTLTTVTGQQYTLDFFAYSDVSQGSATIRAFFGGIAVTASPVTVPANTGFFTEFTYTVQATGPSTTLTFNLGFNPLTSLNFNLFLDDVSVTAVSAAAVPEPSSAVLCGLAIGLFGTYAGWRRRRGG